MVISHEYVYMDYKAQIYQRYARAFKPQSVLEENNNSRLIILEYNKILCLKALNHDYPMFFLWKVLLYPWETVEKYKLKFHEVKYMSYRLSIKHPDPAWQGDMQYLTTLIKNCREWNKARKSGVL